MTISIKKKAVEAVEGVENVHPVRRVRSLRKLVPSAISTRTGRASLVVQKNSPQLLFGAGLVFGVATVVSASVATLKLEGVLDDIRTDLEDLREMEERSLLNAKEVRLHTANVRLRGVAKVAKLYAPSLALGTMAVAALTGSHHIMNKRNVAITAAYSGMEKAFDEYRERVKEKFGEEADRNLLHGVQERTVVEELESGEVKKKRVKTFGKSVSPYARVWDENSSSEWKNNAYSNRNFVKCQQQWANDMLQHKGHLFLNEVYRMLGLEETTAGQRVGWFVGNGDSYVDFGIFDRLHTDQVVYDFMFGEEKSILLDFNVDGDVHKLLDELRNNKN